MYQHLLVPIDGTPLATVTVDHAVAYAQATGARLTFLHVRPDMAATSDGALLHAMSPEMFADAAAGNARAVVAKAEASARAAGVSCDSLVETGDRPYEIILEAAVRAGCDMVLMASHGRHGLKGAVLGSVTRKVLDRATLPVLVAAVESNMASLTDEQQALAVIRDEHRSLAAVLHALTRLAGAPAPADPQLLRAMVSYIEQFPERQHHPKEDVYLFRKLRERTRDCDALIAELERQHVAGAGGVARMRSALDAGPAADFAQAVNDFAALQWRHMDAEEKLVLPAAHQHLHAEDWREIARAFSANGDPRFDASESFEALAARLLELAGRRQGASSANEKTRA
jgi:nucleotide-binding universal stress UspA family protein/hemerythrin-like domain-containing protein